MTYCSANASAALMDFSFRGQALMAIFFVAFLFYFNFRVSSLKHLGGCPRIILFFLAGCLLLLKLLVLLRLLLFCSFNSCFPSPLSKCLHSAARCLLDRRKCSMFAACRFARGDDVRPGFTAFRFHRSVLKEKKAFVQMRVRAFIF